MTSVISAPSKPTNFARRRRSSGFSLIELLVTMSILAIGMSILALNLKPLGDPLEAASEGVSNTLTRARAKAMATTAAYRVRPTDSTTVVVERALRCTDATWTSVTTFGFELEQRTKVNENWQVCFNSRGVATNTGIITIEDDKNKKRELTVLLAGGVQRVRPD